MSTPYLEKVVTRFLALTENSELWAQALRAITLHMLSGYSRTTFEQFQLEKVLLQTVENIKEQKIVLSKEMSPMEGMSIVDIWFVLKEKGIFCHYPNKDELKSYLEDLLYKQGQVKYAWLLGEMAYCLGLDARLNDLRRDQHFYKQHLNTMDYAYWLTHKYFLGTRYLHHSLPTFGFSSVTTELLGLTKWIVEEGSFDLAAEVAICLDLAGKSSTQEYGYLLGMIMGALKNSDGAIVDPLLEDTDYNLAHTAAATMLALAKTK